MPSNDAWFSIDSNTTLSLPRRDGNVFKLIIWLGLKHVSVINVTPSNIPCCYNLVMIIDHGESLPSCSLDK